MKKAPWPFLVECTNFSNQKYCLAYRFLIKVIVMARTSYLPQNLGLTLKVFNKPVFSSMCLFIRYANAEVVFLFFYIIYSLFDSTNVRFILS